MRLIDADALRKNMKFVCMGVMAGTENFNAPLCEIDNAPTVTPEPHWIPVTEDTPKEAGTYMCTCYDAGRRIVTLVKWQPRTKTWNLIGARAYWKVIAWCKRPEPYKGVTE